MRTAIRFALLALTLTPALPTRAPAQSRPTQHEIVRGRITGDSSRAVSGATVVVTRVSDRQFKTVDSDASGHYSTDWPDGTGDYVVNVSARGYTAVSRRVRAD